MNVLQYGVKYVKKCFIVSNVTITTGNKYNCVNKILFERKKLPFAPGSCFWVGEGGESIKEIIVYFIRVKYMIKYCWMQGNITWSVNSQNITYISLLTFKKSEQRVQLCSLVQHVIQKFNNEINYLWGIVLFNF